MKKFAMLMTSLIFLAACSNDKTETTTAEELVKEPEQEVAAEQQQEMTEEGFITQVTTDKILVNNIYFTIPEGTEVNYKNGEETSAAVISDIRTGMKVNIEYQGPPTNSFPMEGKADAVSILNDAESKTQSDALLAFIEKEQLSRLLMLGQPIVRDDKIGFLFTNMDTGKMSEVRIDLNTHEYTIGNE